MVEEMLAIVLASITFLSELVAARPTPGSQCLHGLRGWWLRIPFGILPHRNPINQDLYRGNQKEPKFLAAY